MTTKDWADIVAKAQDDASQLLVIAKCLREAEDAKCLLRHYGFGVAGTPLIVSVRQAITAGRPS